MFKLYHPFASNSSDEDDENMGSPTSLSTQDSGITVNTKAGKELITKVIQVSIDCL